jgi:hypothetical protein
LKDKLEIRTKNKQGRGREASPKAPTKNNHAVRTQKEISKGRAQVAEGAGQRNLTAMKAETPNKMYPHSDSHRRTPCGRAQTR